MKQYFKQILLTVFLSAMVSSCTDEIMENESGQARYGQVRANLYLNIPLQDMKHTHLESDEVAITDIHLLVFNTDGSGTPTTLDQQADETGITVSDGNVHFTATLAATEEERAIYVVANVSLAELTEGMSFTDIQTKLQAAAMHVDNNTSTITENLQAHPMISDKNIVPGIPATFSLGSASKPIKMYRNTVKVIATTEKMTTADFVLASINIWNAPVTAYLFPGVDGSALARYPFAEGMEGGYLNDTKTTTPLYCYEAPLLTGEAAKNAFFILKGEYKGQTGYYKIEVLQPNANQKLVPTGLLRNTQYTVNIKDVQKTGYATAEEAAAHAASNMIAYNIFIDDIYSTDIVSNGEQFLGVTNSDFVVHADPGIPMNNLLAVTLSYTTKSGWQPGSITCSQGITSLSGNTIPLVPVDATRADADIYISIEEGTTTGSITFKIGDLTKVITVRRLSLTESTYFGGAVNLTGIDSNKPIVMSEVSDPLNTEWLRVEATNLSGTPNLNNAKTKVTLAHDMDGNRTQDLYLHIRSNQDPIFTPTTHTKGYFYVSYTNDHGRSKYCIIKTVTTISFDPGPEGYGAPYDLYDWVNQNEYNNQVDLIIPQQIPLRTGYEFMGWKDDKDGLYQPNETFTITFGAQATLQAAWKKIQVFTPFIQAGGIYWAKGNLIANSKGKAVIGSLTDGSLLFKFGSLIGFDANFRIDIPPVPKAIPAGFTASQDPQSAAGENYTYTGSIAADDAANGTGDPCRYWIGQDWRLPTREEYDALGLASGANFSVANGVNGTNEKGEPEALKFPTEPYYRYEFVNWKYTMAATMYQTSSANTTNYYNSFSFTSGGTISGQGTGSSDFQSQRKSVGAVRCVRDTNPNNMP